MSTTTTNSDQPDRDETDSRRTRPGMHGRRPGGRVNLGKHHPHDLATGGVFVEAGDVVEGQLLDDYDTENENNGPAPASDTPGADDPPGGELVPLTRPAGLVRQAGGVAKRQTVQMVKVVRVVATHPTTKTGGKAVARNMWWPVAGAMVVSKRWRDTHGASRYERMMRAAEVAGDREMLLEWEARDVTEKAARHGRVMDWVRSPLDLIRALAVGCAAVVGLLLTLGVILAIAQHDIGQVIGPISAVISAIAWLVWFFTVYGTLLITAATVGGIAYLWQVGRTHTDPPAWTTPTGVGDPMGRDVVPDEGAILNALKNLNLAPLNRKFKEGWTPRWVLGTGRDGKGWRTQLELPPGVTVEMINGARAVLAHNLVRLPVEVWPTEPKRLPGVLDLWVADQGLLTGPVEPYPLLHEGDADYFKGVPVGIDQRGTTIHGSLMAGNYGIAGIMGSGKTSLVVNLLCGAMLDPLVDIDVYVMAYNVDYDPMRPRLRSLVKGDEDEHVIAAMDALRALRSEVTLRGKILAELGGDETKVTRALAEREARLRPRVVVFDECQEMFRHPEFGEEAKELAIKVMTKARKCAITLLFVTPAPSAGSLPRDLAKTVSHAVCFAIRDHQGNDAILGTGAHKAGITATTLVPGEDVGTAMASGFGPVPGLLRTHYIRREKGHDDLTPIVKRAVALRDDAGITPTPVDEPAAGPDLLADVAAALVGRKRMRTQEVLALLTGRNRAVYGGWTFADLADALPDSAKPYKSGGVMVVGTDRVAEALADRDTESNTESDGQPE